MNKNNYRKISLTTLFILGIFIIPSFSFAITSNTLSNGLMGHWTLDAGYVTDKIYDTSGQNNHGYFYNGATSTAKVSGRVGGAMNFDGVDDYIKIGTAGSGTFNYSVVTVSVWVKRTAAMASFDGIVTSELNTINEKGWALIGNISNQVYFATNHDAWYESSRYILPLNEWHHITGVFSGSTNTLYVDGVIVGTSNPAAISYTGTRSIAPAIGVYPENNYLVDEYFPGSIDDVRVYNRALSATEIKQLYQLGASKFNVTPTQPLTSGLVAHWTLDGKDTNWLSSTVGTTTDKSGNGNTGTMTNMSRSTAQVLGKIGQALKFDGGNDYINVPSRSNLNSTTFSWSGWVKFNNIDTSNQFLFQNFENSGPAYGGWGLVVNRSSVLGCDVGEICFWLSSNTGGDYDYAEVSHGMTKSNYWYNITATYNNSTRLASYYIDGVLIGSVTSSVSGVNFPASPETNIGKFDILYLNGSMDDVRVYNRVLTATEIKQLYNLAASKYNTTPTQPLTSGLVGHWTMDGKDTVWTSSTAGTVIDKSGNGNTGTLTNMSRSTAQAIGKAGQALKFDGSNDYVETNYVLPTTNFSFAFWAKSTSSGINNRAFGNADALAGLSGADVIWGYPSNNHLYIVTRQGANVSTYDIDATVSNLHAGWHYILVTVDSSLGAKVYYDGQLAGSNVLSTAITSSLTTRIGRDGNGADAFNGSIDDVRIYNRALSASEIKQLYNQGR